MIDIFNLLTIIAALYLASSGEPLMTFATKRKYGVRLEQIVLSGSRSNYSKNVNDGWDYCTDSNHHF